MDLVKINAVTEAYGISSRTLRYYEEVGILWSCHPENKVQRYYDEQALQRLGQIMVLRKMQIPIKDIVEIFKSREMSAVINAFTDKIESLDNEITALAELRQIVDNFLQEMIEKGVKKISAIPLLYEETEKRLIIAGEKEKNSYEKLSEISREALKLHDVRIIRLPEMRVLTSKLKTGGIIALDSDKMENLFSSYGLIPQPGMRNCFYKNCGRDQWVMMMKIPEEFENNTPYEDEYFPGGLYAAASSFMEDMDGTFSLLRDWINRNKTFEIEKDEKGNLLRSEIIEELLPWDIALMLNQYQQDVFIPLRLKTED